MLRPQDYQNALDVQSAANLSGVVRSFHEVLSKIWEEARAQNKGTEWVNRHSISRLYAEQIAFLASGGGIDNDWVKYSDAYEACQQAARGEATVVAV